MHLPSAAMATAVNRLARLTGSDPVPPHKVAMGYVPEKNKLSVAGFQSRHTVPSRTWRGRERKIRAWSLVCKKRRKATPSFLPRTL